MGGWVGGSVGDKREIKTDKSRAPRAPEILSRKECLKKLSEKKKQKN